MTSGSDTDGNSSHPSTGADSGNPSAIDDRTEHEDLLEETLAEEPRESTGGRASDSDLLDELLERCLESLVEIAPVSAPSDLCPLLPHTDVETRRFLLVELIKLDMASAAESGAAAIPRIEWYLDGFGEVMSVVEVPIDLLMEELQLRRESGEQPQAEEYRNRFPKHDGMIDELFAGQMEAQPESTAAVQSRLRPPELAVGQRIDDFVIVQTLGSGAFANVYLAKQISMSRLVALKVSRGTGDEPQALAQFDHPNIVRVFDQRELDNPPAHLLYMQFHPGGTLADVVQRVRGVDAERRSGQIVMDAIDRSLLRTAQAVPERSLLRDYLATLSWPMTVAWIGIELTKALDDAHSRCVMHRDVKPANVLLAADGVPKLADFNVSFAGSAGRAGAASSFGGSIGYMSPEHLRAISARPMEAVEEVGPQADLYALAILLWELWQGRRPFDCESNPSSWTQAVSQQLETRSNVSQVKVDSHDAVSRQLEKVLRHALEFDVEDRIGSGKQMAAKLKLALHPEAAQLFDPDHNSWQGWLSRRSPWLVAVMLILIPNAIAGLFGWCYNRFETFEGFDTTHPEIMSFFIKLSNSINAIAFPLAIVLIMLYTRRVVHALRKIQSGKIATSEDIESAIELSHRAAVIGGVLWCIAAVVYPAVLYSQFSDVFTQSLAGHFFLSHVICGGVAAIYPFFGLSVYATSIWYPKMIRETLDDPDFDARARGIVRRCERYLLLACLVPLLGVALLVVSHDISKLVILIAIAATVLGLFAAFYAYKFILERIKDMRPILSTDKQIYASS